MRTRAKIAERVRGRGCKIYVGEEYASVDINWLITPVPGNGSCFISAIARALGKLNLAALKQHPGLEGVAWTAVEAWADLGKRLTSGEDPHCTGLRARISRLLWDNVAAIRAGGYMPMPLRVGHDITDAAYRRALRTATGLGMAEPGDDQVKRWAVALLESTTHFTDDAIRAVLAIDFNDDVAILVVRRDHASCDGSGGYIDRLHVLQTLVPAKAELAIGVYLKC